MYLSLFYRVLFSEQHSPSSPFDTHLLLIYNGLSWGSPSADHNLPLWACILTSHNTLVQSIQAVVPQYITTHLFTWSPAHLSSPRAYNSFQDSLFRSFVPYLQWSCHRTCSFHFRFIFRLSLTFYPSLSILAFHPTLFFFFLAYCCKSHFSLSPPHILPNLTSWSHFAYIHSILSTSSFFLFLTFRVHDVQAKNNVGTALLSQIFHFPTAGVLLSHNALRWTLNTFKPSSILCFSSKSLLPALTPIFMPILRFPEHNSS